MSHMGLHTHPLLLFFTVAPLLRITAGVSLERPCKSRYLTFSLFSSF